MVSCWRCTSGDMVFTNICFLNCHFWQYGGGGEEGGGRSIDLACSSANGVKRGVLRSLISDFILGKISDILLVYSLISDYSRDKISNLRFLTSLISEG